MLWPTPHVVAANLSTPFNGSAFDFSICHAPSGYLTDGQSKTLEWEDGIPYARHELFGRIRMNSLHLQGGGKGLLDSILDRSRNPS